MQRCAGCRRHIAVVEHECPFCHAQVGLVTAALVAAISVMSIGCGPRVGADGQESGGESTTGSDDTNGTSVTTTATTTSGTTSTTSTSSTTTDTPTTTFTTSEDTS